MFARIRSNLPTAPPETCDLAHVSRKASAVWEGSTLTGVTLNPSDAEFGLPIRLLHDRVLVRMEAAEGERRSSAGLVIPATASMGTRLSWATAVGVGPHVRSIQVGDRVLFDPDERSEVELHGESYVLLRERDVHAVAATRVEPDSTGLYL